MKRVFIYGSLKAGEFNHYVMEQLGANKISEVTTVEKYPLFMLRESFPWLQDTKGTGNIVQGEMYEVPEDSMPHLDTFEGVSKDPSRVDMYKRGTITVTDGETEHEVGTYFRGDELDATRLGMLELLEKYEGPKL